MVWSSLAPKWPITVPFVRMDHQKSNFSLISDSLFVGGYWGQPMSFFWKLVDETQIPKPPEATRNHNSIKLLIPQPLRADLRLSVHCETPCTWPNRPVGAKILSGFQFEGKTDVWISQVRRVKAVLWHAFFLAGEKKGID